VSKFNKGAIYVPDYQRDFIWDRKRQSRLIESLLLGLPIPSIFLADVYDNAELSKNTDREGDLEIVDGCQRINTLSTFVNNELQLVDLEVLTELNGKKFSDFSPGRQKRFLNIPIKTIVLSDKNNAEARFMMFDRVNTGGDELRDMEKRKGIYGGKFTDLIYNKCAKNELFKQLTYFTPTVGKRNEAEELILRFFAYADRYPNFNDNSQADFLDNYLKNKNEDKSFDESVYYNRFVNMVNFINLNFPNKGFLKYEGSQKTPRVRFEALSVGVDMVLRERKISQKIDVSWADEDEFNTLVTGSNTSSPKRVRERIEYVKHKILAQL
jgi:hypothetical protein